jgi:hypothetical protein
VEWAHENASKMMFENLVEENNIDISKEQIDTINAIIDGTPLPKYAPCLIGDAIFERFY